MHMGSSHPCTGLCVMSDEALTPPPQWNRTLSSVSSSLECQSRRRLQLLGQPLMFGSSKAAVPSLLAGRLLTQPCSSCFMSGDICSSTTTALCCLYFLYSIIRRDKFVFFSNIFQGSDLQTEFLQRADFSQGQHFK